MMKGHDPHRFHTKEGEKDAAVLSKVHHGDKQNKKDDRQTHRQPK
jgi:hypothetical protein